MKCGASPSTETVNARQLFWVGGSFVPPRTQYRTFVFKEVDLDISPNVKKFLMCASEAQIASAIPKGSNSL